jgi:hypothetical protein
MRWVHCHKRCGAYVALTALALQIVLSFGHVHAHVAGHAPSHLAAAGIDKSALAKALGHPPAQNPVQNPAQNPDDDDYCAICASISLASSTFVPLAPQLPVPVGFERIEHALSAVPGILEPRRVAFRSRAPPAA